MSYRIVFIGAGNLATHLSYEFKKSGCNIVQIYSRTSESANRLAKKLETKFTTSPTEIVQDADIYVVALKDSAYNNVLPFVNFNNKLLVHCSGTMPLSSLKKYSENIGVLYPLQTFSKEQPVEFNEIPIFIEANKKENENRLHAVAKKISQKVFLLSSGQRKYIHIAAVFACNFVNHFYAIAGQILESKNIPFEVINPLIRETAEKVRKMKPKEAQTGPAVRFDKNVISEHMEALKEFPEDREIYRIISESIYKFHKTDK